MKNNGAKKKTGWIVGLVGIIMIAGVILSQSPVWAADVIQNYTIRLENGGQEVQGICIAATKKGEDKPQWKESKPGEDGKSVVFNDVFTAEEEYTIKISPDEKSPDEKYYPKEIVVNSDKDKPIYPQKQEEDGSYQFDLTIAVDQKVDILIGEKEEGKLSELLTLPEDETNLVFEKENQIYIYNNKTDRIEAALTNVEDVTAVGYKNNEGTISLFQGATAFELTETTYLTEIYIQKNNEGWEEYKLDPEAHIVFDKTAPEIKVPEEEKVRWISGKEGEEVKINFTVENAGEDKEECSDIERVYWCKKGETEETDLGIEGDTFGFTDNNPNKNKDTIYLIYAVDKAGNESEPGKVVVHCDITAPEIKKISMDSESEIAFHTSATKSSKPVTMTVMAKDTGDTGSGIKNVSLKLDGTDELKSGVIGKENENGETPFTFTFNSGEFVIEKIICEDKVGNTFELLGNSLVDKFAENRIKSNIVRVKKTAVTITADIISKTTQDQIYVVQKGNENEKKVIAVSSVDEDKELKISVNEDTTTPALMGIKSVRVGNQKEELIAKEDQFSCETNVKLNKLDLIKGEKNEIKVDVIMAGGQKQTLIFDILYDTACPKIKKIMVEDENENELVEKGFGTFCNKKVSIIVEAEDVSGIKSIMLSFNEGENKIVEDFAEENIENGVIQYEIDIQEEAKKYSLFRVTATDHVGNVCKNEVSTEDVENSNLRNGILILEKKSPVIEISVPSADSNKNWYSSDINFAVRVNDSQSGLSSVQTNLEGKTSNKETTEYYGETNDTVLNISTEDVKKAQDGSYKLTVIATDNAGNVENADKIIYIDDTKPEINSFEFEAEGYREGKKTEFGVKQRDYGYYFSEKTKVTVRAKDAAPSSGLRSITYYTVNKDGKKSEEKTQEVSGSGSISFSIPANFKGQIYARPTDNVGHSADRYVTPDATVIENSAQHNEDSDIIITKTKTSKKDAKGQDLYKKDVDVTIEVSDKYSGIREVEYSVTAPYDTEKNQKGTIEIDNTGEKKKGSASGWKRTGREKNLVTKLTGNLVVSHNSNDISVNVKLTDRAGHISKKRIKFSIDKTRPLIQISYDNNKKDKEFDDFYKEKRTASVVVTERNFDAEQIKYSVSNKDGETPSVDLTQAGPWQKKENKKDPDQTTYTAQIPFYEDGMYTWNLSFRDRAGNKAAEVETQKFTIDQTAPVITVTYDNVEAQNTNYFKKERLATISITEHNFEEGRIKIKGKGSSDGKEVSFPSVSAWSGQGDIHTATILYSEDAEYSFDIAYTDKAGNIADAPGKDTFVIDKTAPEVSIEKVENKSANKGTVKPVVRYTDVNLDPSTVNISLHGFKRKQVKNAGETREIKNGAEFIFEDFKKEKEVDDIYTLTVSAQDMAGNRSEVKTVSFSVNRFGSTYTFGDTLKSIMSAGKQNNGVEYLKELKEDVILTEVNVDELQKKMSKIKLTRNGESRDLTANDYKVDPTGGGERWKKREWSTYIYTIKKENFSEDGVYKVEVRSEDDAGNKNKTVDKAGEPSIKFAIDKTAPVIIPIDLENDKQYPLESKEVTISVKDNLVTPETKIYLNESEVQYKTEDGKCILTIPSAGRRQSLRIVATDTAGNEQSVTVSDFLVSTNLFVRWYNNLPLFIGTLVVTGTLFVLAVVLLAIRKRKKKEGAN